MAMTLEQLYASIGKTPDLIDQQGRDFWGGRIAAGEDVTQDFQNSARTVYDNMLSGQASPYLQQNMAGYQNMTGTQPNISTPGSLGVGSQYQGFYDSPGGQMLQNGGGGMAPAADLNAYSQSPYLAAMGQGLRDQFTGFMNDGLAANRGNAVAAGGVGGSRQGIAEARTMTDAGKGFDSALANLYGNDYQQQMGRNLQQYGMDQQFNLGQAGLGLQAAGQANQYDLGRRGMDLGYLNANNSYNLGLGGLDLQARGQDMNFYNTNRQLDQNGVVIGANLYGQGMQGPWNTLNNANGIAAPYAGNGTTVVNTSSGGGALGALGGGLGVAQLGKNFGLRD